MVTQKTMQIPLADLTTIRLTCSVCNATTEIGCDQLNTASGIRECSYCRTKYIADGVPFIRALHSLEEVVKAVKELQGKLEISFVVPVPADK